MHTAIAELEQAQIRSDIPDFRPGDTLKVHVRVTEGNRSRIQVFQGVVIRRQGGGVRETFTVRKISYGVGVERTFPVHTPVDREDRGRDPRPSPPGQAVLPARPARQGGPDQGASRSHPRATRPSPEYGTPRPWQLAPRGAPGSNAAERFSQPDKAPAAGQARGPGKRLVLAASCRS